MEVSWNGGYPWITHFTRIFPLVKNVKTNHFGDPPFMETPIWVNTANLRRTLWSATWGLLPVDWRSKNLPKRDVPQSLDSGTCGICGLKNIKKTGPNNMWYGYIHPSVHGKSQDINPCWASWTPKSWTKRLSVGFTSFLIKPPNRPPHMGLSKKWAPKKSNGSKSPWGHSSPNRWLYNHTYRGLHPNKHEV